MQVDGGVVVPITAYLVYTSLELTPVSHLHLAQTSTPMNRAPIDRTLWLENTVLSTVTTGFLFVSRIVRWAFLVYFGFATGWLYAVVAFVASIPAAPVLSTIVDHLFGGVRTASTLLLPILPLLLVGLFFTV